MRPPTVPDGYQVTPFGYFHPTCVKHLVEGDVILKDEGAIRHANGSFDSLQTCNYPHYDARGRVVSATKANNTNPSSPSISDSWIEAYSVTTNSSYGKLTAGWVVPPSPATSENQTLFFFPGMVDYSDEQSIIQPVLGWNRDYSDAWGIASWNCCILQTAYESSPVAVNSGDTIQGTIASTCSAGTLTCPSWNITTEDVSSGQSTTLSQSSNIGQTFNQAYAGTVEVYGINQCSDFPPNGAITFYNLALYDDSFNEISSPGWTFVNYYTGLTPQCNYGGQETATQVVLDYGPQQAATPNESNVTVTLNGTPPTAINYWVTFQDATPGATIHYQVTICNSPYAWATVTPGSQVDFYNPCPSVNPYGSMYATAPGYSQSSSTSLSF